MIELTPITAGGRVISLMPIRVTSRQVTELAGVSRAIGWKSPGDPQRVGASENNRRWLPAPVTLPRRTSLTAPPRTVAGAFHFPGRRAEAAGSQGEPPDRPQFARDGRLEEADPHCSFPLRIRHSRVSPVANSTPARRRLAPALRQAPAFNSLAHEESPLPGNGS